jgi:hypothetical protein
LAAKWCNRVHSSSQLTAAASAGWINIASLSDPDPARTFYHCSNSNSEQKAGPIAPIML